MSTVQTTKRIETKLDEAFDLTNAFVWEGHAHISSVSSNEKEILLNIYGNSSCEHHGDLDGIRSQVHDLNGERTVIDDITYVITSAEINKEITEVINGDGEFNVAIYGTVIIKIA